MRKMIVGIKDAAKLFAVALMSCCAVFVCTLFLNFYIDIQNVRDQITVPQALVLYEAQVSTSKIVCIVSGGCLLVTTAILLIFYVKNYINTHKKELGILKALGYSPLKIAVHFWVFGSGVFIGALAGFAAAFAFMPNMYELQNEDLLLPEIEPHFHLILLVCLVILPTVFFALLSVFFTFLKLKAPVLSLLKDSFTQKMKKRRKAKIKEDDIPFLAGLKKASLQSRKSLVFFMMFGSFCYAAMTQMSVSMDDLSSPMMGGIILAIGLLLSFLSLFLALASVIQSNTKTLAMMKTFGYSLRECRGAIFDGYRPLSYIGFAVGTIYQYALLRIMVDIVFKDIENVPEYEFDFPAMLISLASFAVLYEAILYFYSGRIRKISVKEIMLE